jgi:hypothetical protein
MSQAERTRMLENFMWEMVEAEKKLKIRRREQLNKKLFLI